MVLGRYRSITGMSRERYWDITGTLPEWFWNITRMLLEHDWNVNGMSLEHHWHVTGTSRVPRMIIRIKRADLAELFWEESRKVFVVKMEAFLL